MNRNFTTKKPKDSMDSFMEQMDILIKQLDTIRQKATKDYNEFKRYSKENDNNLSLEYENARANALRTLEKFFDLRVKILSIHAGVVKESMKSNKGNSDELENKINKGHDELQEMINSLRK